MMIAGVLAYLGAEPEAPGLEALTRLVTAYHAHVPWETATRIVKRTATPETDDCPRWPEEFWRDAVTRGGGGTCYESNYAFFALLRALGYEGYLTLNSVRGPNDHAAIVLQLDGGSWLVDVGIVYPMAPLPLHVAEPRMWPRPAYRCALRPDVENRYLVERDIPPTEGSPVSPVVYTLTDAPIDDAAFRAVTTADYGPRGLFLDQVTIGKLIDGRLWLFTSRRQPLALRSFDGTNWTVQPLEGEPAPRLAAHFGLEAAAIREALEAVARRSRA